MFVVAGRYATDLEKTAEEAAAVNPTTAEPEQDRNIELPEFLQDNSTLSSNDHSQ